MKNHTDSLVKASSDIGAHISDALQEAMRENTHDLHRVSERLADSINVLANKGKDAASDMQHRFEKEAKKASATAEHYIQDEPFKSVMIAAGVGAAAAALVSMWIGSRAR
jgi:ElaB/YqjD/DUF883 family membrane-anchored ribosome-binding protein